MSTPPTTDSPPQYSAEEIRDFTDRFIHNWKKTGIDEVYIEPIKKLLSEDSASELSRSKILELHAQYDAKYKDVQRVKKGFYQAGGGLATTGNYPPDCKGPLTELHKSTIDALSTAHGDLLSLAERVGPEVKDELIEARKKTRQKMETLDG